MVGGLCQGGQNEASLTKDSGHRGMRGTDRVNIEVADNFIVDAGSDIGGKVDRNLTPLALSNTIYV
jgi:hypothetical protein